MSRNSALHLSFLLFFVNYFDVVLFLYQSLKPKLNFQIALIDFNRKVHVKYLTKLIQFTEGILFLMVSFTIWILRNIIRRSTSFVFVLSHLHNGERIH